MSRLQVHNGKTGFDIKISSMRKIRVDWSQNRRVLLRTTAAAAALGVAFTLTACGSDDGGYHPQSAQSAPKSAEVTAVPAPEDAAPSQLPDVEGLLGQRLVTPDGIAARWSYLPGDDDFNKQLAEAVKAQVLDFTQGLGIDYKPQGMPVGSGLEERGCVLGSSYKSAKEILSDPQLTAADGEQKLSVACDVFFASGSVLAERLRFVTGDGSGENVSSDQTQAFYTDLETGAAAGAKDLLKADNAKELFRTFWHFAVADDFVPKEYSPDSEADAPADLTQALLDNVQSVQFTDNGDTLITVDGNYFRSFNPEDAAVQSGGNSESEKDDSLTISVPLDLASAYLTDLGVKVAQSYQEPAEWVGTPNVPAGNVYTDCSLTPCVAVTFDDGPGPQTPEVLDILAKNHSAATFFLLGIQVQQYPDTVKNELDAGMELGNHSWNHKDLTTVDAAQIQQQVTDTNNAINDASGHTPTLLRPPYGAWNDQVLNVASLPAILWSIDTEDWKLPGTDKLVAAAVDPAVAGDIILMHDIHPETVAAVPQIVEGLRGRGFVLATISELYQGDPVAGDIYYRQYY